MEGKQNILHGTLEASIFEATPYTPPFPFTVSSFMGFDLQSCFRSPRVCLSYRHNNNVLFLKHVCDMLVALFVYVKCVLANGKPTYVTIKLDDTKVAKTSLERDRVWNQTFQILCAHRPDSTITVTMKTKCSVLGKFSVQARQILNESSLINGFFPLQLENGKTSPEMKLRFMLWFKPAELEPKWRNLIENGGFQGLRNASFPQRSNCNVKLYQDAHHTPAFQPPFSSPRKLWEDVYKAIEGAKHLIYIAGWSFNPKMVLVRDPETNIPHARGVKLGELLKQKAEEGVAVRIMLWNDETSLPFIKNQGIMRTHDEDAFAYFKHTKVICKLCPRLHHKFPTLFAHHQKTVTVDTRAPHGSSITDREITSFLGGVDLCDGRYDTEQHSLFRTLNTDSHCFDFYQTSISGASLHKGGPREPWHDAHACITGEVAWDVLANFEQRWRKQCDPSLLLPINSIPSLVRRPFGVDEDRNWKVQVFRSIDHVSTNQLAKNLTVEQSIHEAYVEAIRRAERFIYIENQYFIGGCHLWDKDNNSGCRNLIPIEIALKVVSKIKAKERFAVYILMPMWPEGVPESEPVQDILHWTWQTMAMMYKLIGEAMKESGEEGHPRDYLNFFCLANREQESKQEFVPPNTTQPETQYWNAQKHRRFMIYVHSKVMIVDDLYILIGSANVNQRSMDGRRDTEIAIGGYQVMSGNPEIDCTTARDIHNYRMSLWYEHTGLADDIFLEPESLECVNKMRSLGDKMWQIYADEEIVDMEGVHLVTYPVNVTVDGLIKDVVENDGIFPDTKSPVKGRRSKVLPPVFTT